MKKGILYFMLCVTVITSGSCDVVSKIDLSTIEVVRFEPSEDAEVNHGKSFNGVLIAQLNNGEQVDITSSRKIDFIGNDLTGKLGSYTITKSFPDSFNDTVITTRVHISNNKGETTVSSELALNFNGGFFFHDQGGPGETGTQGEKGRNKILDNGLIRSGDSGEDGGTGQNGRSSNPMQIYVWKENSIYYLLGTNLEDQIIFRYMTKATDDVLISLKGADGGKGGSGGKGGKGRDGFKKNNGKIRKPGDGGSGGNGGVGGNGGAGGNLTLIVHPSAKSFSSRFTYDLSGGQGGAGGQGGNGGSPGNAMEGQANASTGQAGQAGVSGQAGNSGSYSIENQNFDWNDFK